MKNRALTFLFSFSVFTYVSARTDTESPFHLPVPDGWFSETIPFPIPFAPSINYEGVEEVRFAPGFVTESDDSFWTYSFVWWMPKDIQFDSKFLEETLVTYYEGFTRYNEAKQGFEAEDERFEARIYSVSPNQIDEANFVGSVVFYEPLVTKRNIDMNIRVAIIRCSGSKQAVFFELSPQPFTHELWTELYEIRKGFECEKK